MHTLSDVIIWRDGITRRGDLTIREEHLTIREEHLVFTSQTEQLSITHVQFVSLEKPRKLTPGAWVRVAYGTGAEPDVVYFKPQKHTGDTHSLFATLQHFPNSGQFDCWVWITYPRRSYQMRLTFAPHKYRELTFLRKATITFTDKHTLNLSIGGRIKSSLVASRITGFTQKTLTVRQQIQNVVRDTLLMSARMSLSMPVILLLQYIINSIQSLLKLHPKPALEIIPLQLLILCSVLSAGVFVSHLFLTFPLLLYLRKLELFTFTCNYSKPWGWEFGVLPQHAEHVVTLLEAHGVKNQERNPP